MSDARERVQGVPTRARGRAAETPVEGRASGTTGRPRKARAGVRDMSRRRGGASGEAVRARDSSQRYLWRFRGYGTPYLGMLSLGFGLRICEMVADLATPWPIAAVIDRVLGMHSTHNPLTALLDVFGTDKTVMLATAAGAVLVVAAVSGAFDYVGDRVMNGVGERMSVAIRADAYAHLQRLPMAYHDRQAVGESTSRIITDCGRVKDSLVALFSTLFPGLLSVTSYASALLLLDWRFGLIGLFCVPLVFLIGARNRQLGHRAAKREREAEGKLAALVTETLNGIRTVHSFGRQGLHDQRFAAESDAALRAGLATTKVQALRIPLLELTTAGGTALLLWIGGSGVLHGWWSVGQLVVAVSYLTGMVSPIKSLSKLSVTFAQGQASAERIIAILDQPRTEPCAPQGLPFRASGRIDFSGVAMAYGSRPALRHLEATILPGERVALTGPNGVGKSTALSLIAGLYRPTRGRVLIDGRPTTALPEQWLHRQVAVVLQDTFLFSGTLAENIRYARPDADDHEVDRAAQAALVTDFAQHLPDGLATRLGDRGVGLSGGQRQRVGIARALLADAPIVLLDEPTSGLDAEAERLVVGALSRLVAGRTVVMTTHRPALLEMATRVVLLGGRGTAPCPAPQSGVTAGGLPR
ncbi:ABC transporter ATP-binding protein/permease [Streptomyces sp. RB6PN25]|uniref:ABC transporter ATP-binding protein/permease n=1 Tax=Streptomyces humicola TaxID=2953240 RepID=A0ABT1PXH0_9ACTN|nr:ABC transporter ATP-binding protein [Streptomyces humicola]MCQ4082344.1 ABC transporter ATP-binding protein/permease [Streptomyces humicola]